MVCPLCNENRTEIISGELRGGEKLPVYYCRQCKLGMLGLKPDNKDLKNYYKKDYRKIASPRLGHQTNPRELFNLAVPFQEDRIKLLNKHFDKNKRLLEIGCSAGMFLWHARKFVKEAVGIDYDGNSAKFAARKCGCRTYSTEVEKTDLKPGSFDLICLFQTLEHVKNPADFILSLKKYLKSGGIMAIEVPNLRDVLVYAYDLPNHRRFYYHISHLWYFTEKSLSKLTKICGLKNEKILHIQDYNIFNHINWILNDCPQSSSLPGLSSPIVPFRKNIEPAIKTQLVSFIKKMDYSYKEKLSELKMTSNIFLIARN